MDKDLVVSIESLTQEIHRLSVALEQSKREAAALVRREGGYQSIFQGSPLGLALICADGTFSEVNQALCQMVGYGREQLLRMTVTGLVHPDDRPAAVLGYHQLFEGKDRRGLSWEARLLRTDGTPLWTAIQLSIPNGAFLVASFENIHQRKLLDDALARLATTLADNESMSLAGSWRYNASTGLVSAAAPVCRMFGLAPGPEPVPAEQFFNRIHPADRPGVEHALQMAIDGQAPYQVDCRVELPDGTERLVTASGEIYRVEDEGVSLSVIGIAQDVTMRKRAEQAVRDSEMRIRELFDNAGDGIIIADSEGKCMDANLASCRLLGYRRDELVGKPIPALFAESQHALLAEVRAQLQRDRDRAHLAEWEFVRADGSRLPVEISARLLPDGRWMATVRDINERKRIQLELERYAARIEDLYDNAPCGYHSLDRNGTYLQVNKTELDWLGYTLEEMVGKKKAQDLMTEESRARFLAAMPDFLERGHVADLELEFVRKDGRPLPVLMSATAIRDESGFIMSRTTLFDMTELSAAQTKLRQAAIVFEHTNEAIVVTDPCSNILAVNRAFTRITGYQANEVIGKNPRLLRSERHDRAFYRNLWDSLERDGTWQGQIWDRRKNGELYAALESITVVKDASGKVTNYIGVFSDITAIKQAEEELIRLAYHDALTGLPNRRLFEDRVRLALAHARRSQACAALLLLDVDRFKLINDTLGHAAGDELLQVLAERFRAAIREENTVARLGGDEFAAILTDLQSPEEAALMAQKLARLAAEPVPIAGQQHTVSASIGIAVYPDDAQDPASLAKAADMAMYGAKARGRNTYEFYAPHMTVRADETLAIDRALRSALRLGELELYFQPQVNLGSGRIVGVEALLRWNRPGLGLWTPERFIHVAEETDLIKMIGDWVFDAAWRQLQEWRRAGLPPVRVSINLSVRQLGSARPPRLLEQVGARLAAGDVLDGHGFDAEITETALQTGAETILALSELRASGLRIALDDFGTGYSSLSSLKQLPIDMLKIDRSFIADIPGDADDKAIASAIIAIGHSLGMRVLAEGVETAEQLDFLAAQGCDDVQGFLLYRPLPAAACTELMRDNRRMARPGTAA